MSSDTLQSAIASIRLGDKETGKLLLSEVIRDDPRNEAAWLWMSEASDSDERRRYCLEQVLAINPNNETAHRGLEALSQRQAAEPSRPEKQPEPTPISAVTPLQQIRKLQEQAANATERKRLTVTSPTKKGALTLLIVLAIVTVAVLCVAFVFIASTAQ